LLRVQRWRHDDDDCFVADVELDDGNRDCLELGIWNGRGLWMPGVPCGNVMSSLRLRRAPSATCRSLRGSHRRRELRCRYVRLLRMGGAWHRLYLDALSVGDVHPDEGDPRRRFSGWRRLWLCLRSVPRGADLPAVHLQLLSVDDPGNRLHDGRRLPSARHRLQALLGRRDLRVPERHVRQRNLHGQRRGVSVR
jgi:hypothetical protein